MRWDPPTAWRAQRLGRRYSGIKGSGSRFRVYGFGSETGEIRVEGFRSSTVLGAKVHEPEAYTPKTVTRTPTPRGFEMLSKALEGHAPEHIRTIRQSDVF